MLGRRIELPVGGGALSGLDFGGRGPGVLLVHGSGHNAAVWTDVASRLVDHCHPVAVDLRGHGHSAPTSSTPEQYWAAGSVDAAALCVVDGMVLDDRGTARLAQAQWQGPEAAERLREMFRYGWRASEQDMHAYVEQCVREAGTGWLNAGARPDLVRRVMRRSFLRRADGLWERRPTVEEIATVSAPDPHAVIYPSVDVYARVGCPTAASTPSAATRCGPWSTPLPTAGWSRSRATTTCR